MNEFEEYIKRYAESRGISVEEAKTHMIVKEAKTYYESKEKSEIQISIDNQKLCDIQQ